MIALKKLTIFLLATFCAMILFSSCSPSFVSFNDLAADYTLPTPETIDGGLEQAYRKQQERRTNIALPPVDNTTPWQELCTQEIDIHALSEPYLSYLAIGSWWREGLWDVVANVGVECLRETESGLLYSIHRVKQGGLFYIFYDQVVETGRYDVNAREWGYPIAFSFYLQKKENSTAFATLTPGISLERVKAIAPSAQLTENICKTQPEYSKKGEMIIDLYCTDGILRVMTQKQGGEILVVQKELIPFESLFAKRLIVPDKSLCPSGEILSLDWPE